MNALAELATYLAAKLSMEVGTNVFYFEMPAEPTRCIAITEPKASDPVPPQVDAETHYIEIFARDISSDDGYALAQQCKAALITDENNEDTGFITSPDGLFMSVQVYGGPLPDSRNQQGQRQFYVPAMLINKRL